jgi:hypothetical protein
VRHAVLALFALLALTACESADDTCGRAAAHVNECLGATVMADAPECDP